MQSSHMGMFCSNTLFINDMFFPPREIKKSLCKEALSNAQNRRKKLLPYAGINRQVLRSGAPLLIYSKAPSFFNYILFPRMSVL